MRSKGPPKRTPRLSEKEKRTWAPKVPVYMLRTCTWDSRSTFRHSFKWPRPNSALRGYVEAPDWNPSDCCGYGLHGLLHGSGKVDLLSSTPIALWQVVLVDLPEVVHIRDGYGDKVKVPRGRVVFAGRKQEAYAYLARVRGVSGPSGTNFEAAPRVHVAQEEENRFEVDYVQGDVKVVLGKRVKEAAIHSESASVLASSASLVTMHSINGVVVGSTYDRTKIDLRHPGVAVVYHQGIFRGCPGSTLVYVQQGKSYTVTQKEDRRRNQLQAATWYLVDQGQVRKLGSQAIQALGLS